MSELNKYVNGLVFHAIMKYSMFKYKKNIRNIVFNSLTSKLS